MAQAAFPFDSSPFSSAAGAPQATASLQPSPTPTPMQVADTATADTVGFEIGWDHAHYHLAPPLAHLHAASPVRQGWQAGRAAFGSRTLAGSASVRQWLALRLAAWQAGQVFEGVQVTPHFLSRLAAGAECPVSRQPLPVAADGASAGVVQRLNPDAAYAAGNLVVLHRTVAEARGTGADAQATLGVDEMLALAQRIESGESTDIRGLGAAEWTRLAVLASFATPLPHARAACLPLRVLPGHRARLINPVQALQVVLTLQFSEGGYARRLLGLAALMPSSDARQAFQIFMHTLLARRLAVGPTDDAATLRHAIEDSWADPLVQRRWQRLALRLSAADCETLLERAAQRGLVVGGGRWISREAATDGWALATPRRGRNGVASTAAVQPGASPASAGTGWARPGMARNRGSQKAASCAGVMAAGLPQ